MVNINNKIVFISVIVLIVVSYISYYQGYKIASERVFMCLIYTTILIVFYFTYSVKVAHKMLTKQIKLVVDNIKNILNYYQIEKPIIPPQENETDNKIINQKNQEIMKKSLFFAGCTLILSFAISGGLWIYNNSHHKNYAIWNYLKGNILKNVIILVFVIMTQIFFSTVLIGNILPLESDDVINISIDGLLNGN